MVFFEYVPLMSKLTLIFFSWQLLFTSSDVEDGGETVFPSAPVNSSSSPFYNELSECAKNGLSVKPKMGDALLFWSMKPDGSLDPTSLHGEISNLHDMAYYPAVVLCHSTLILLFNCKFSLGGCPVIKGNKWSSTKWMRVHEYKI